MLIVTPGLFVLGAFGLACLFLSGFAPATRHERERREAKVGNRWFDRLYKRMVE